MLKLNLSRCAGEELDLTSFHLFYTLMLSLLMALALPGTCGKVDQFGTTHTWEVAACG